MSLDFALAIIKIKADTDNWGPFRFSFTNGIPSGATISSATVKSYFSDDTDTTSLLIEAGSVSNGDDYVDLRLQYPGSSYEGYHRLEFTLDFGAPHGENTWVFGYVSVED